MTGRDPESNEPDGTGGNGDASGAAQPPRIPPPRQAAEDTAHWQPPAGAPDEPAPDAHSDPEPEAALGQHDSTAPDDSTGPDDTAQDADTAQEGLDSVALDGDAGRPTVDEGGTGTGGQPADGAADVAGPPDGAPGPQGPEPAAGDPGDTRGYARPDPPGAAQPFDHNTLKSLLGAWALAACSPEESAALEAHLTDCSACAEEALRLRDAVGLLRPEDSLDLDPMLRTRVLEGCLGRRPARIPTPGWAAPYDAETARLDALLRDMADEEWHTPVPLRWFDGRRQARRESTVAGVLGHLLAVDGLVSTALGLPDPLGDTPVPTGTSLPDARTEAYWASPAFGSDPAEVRQSWREQGHSMVRTVSFAGSCVGPEVPYGSFTLPLRDAFLDRAFECWVHAGDIAEAVDYPYQAPTGEHLNKLVDLAARRLPGAIAERRRTGLAAPPQRLGAAGAPGRTLHLEVEGNGGGHWYVPLDSPAAAPAPHDPVAHVALDGQEFCQLAAGHVTPQEAAAGQDGDRQAISDALSAAAALSRM